MTSITIKVETRHHLEGQGSYWVKRLNATLADHDTEMCDEIAAMYLVSSLDNMLGGDYVRVTILADNGRIVGKVARYIGVMSSRAIQSLRSQARDNGSLHI